MLRCRLVESVSLTAVLEDRKGGFIKTPSSGHMIILRCSRFVTRICPSRGSSPKVDDWQPATAGRDSVLELNTLFPASSATQKTFSCLSIPVRPVRRVSGAAPRTRHLQHSRLRGVEAPI